MRKLFIKGNRYKLLLALVYAILFIPFIYSVFYSMPANDDYPLALSWWSNSIIIESVHRMCWNYMHWFGQSGIIAILIQVLFNPLHWFKDAGHSFGICMVIVFILVAAGTLVAVRRLLFYVSDASETFVADVGTCLTALILFTTYYYSDVYNWWSGVAGYSLMMLLSIFNFGYIAKYQRTGEKASYLKMIVVGIITCTSLMNCVATGLFYILFVFVIAKREEDNLLRKLVPLVLYVMAGILMVIAPGNYDRMFMTGLDSKPDYKMALIVSAYRTVTRLFVTLKSRPWVLALILIIVILGMRSQPKHKVEIWHIVLSSICVIVAAFGAIFPYVAGSGKDFSVEFTPRIYFIEDYIVTIGFSLVALKFGQWLSTKRIAILINSTRNVVGIVSTLVLVGVISTIAVGSLGLIVPIDIIKNHSLIKESYYFWDDIIDEIQYSDENDVVVERKNITWCPYVYYTSIDDGSADWPVGDDIYYCGCNQGVARFYNKERVRVLLYD